MKTELVPAASDESLSRAVEVLGRGGLVAFPTDTVYGLAAAVFDEPAVRSLYEVKGRPAEKAIPILLSSRRQLNEVGTAISASAFRLAERYWPGPLTIVIPKHPRIPDVVAGATVGVRIPDHPVALALIERTGPLAVTSANFSGRPSPVVAEQVMEQLGGVIALVLDGGPAPGGRPSTVVDCTGTRLVVLRDGPLTLEQLNATLES